MFASHLAGPGATVREQPAHQGHKGGFPHGLAEGRVKRFENSLLGIDDHAKQRFYSGNFADLTRTPQPQHDYCSMTTATFKATLNRPETQGTATFIEVPLDVPAIFGRPRPPVRVTINGHTYRSTIALYGTRYYLPVNRSNREAAGVEPGDTVTVEIALDTEVRQVSVPEDLQAALDNDPDAAAGFERLSYSHQREHVVWIEAAGREETRVRRISQTLERLHRVRPQ